MAADLRCFTDSTCTTELSLESDSLYKILLGGTTGINGSIGKNFNTVFYVRNCGTRAALHTQVELISSDDTMFSLITDPNIGDLREGEIVSIALRTKVSAGTTKKIAYVYLNFTYYTLPDIEENRFNPYTALRTFIEEYGYGSTDYVPISDATVTMFSDATDVPITEAELDTDHSGDISANEWKTILSTLNIEPDTEDILNNFEAMDVQKIIDAME